MRPACVGRLQAVVALHRPDSAITMRFLEVAPLAASVSLISIGMAAAERATSL